MIRIGLSTCAVAVGMLFSAGALADAMSKSEYKAGNERIAGELKSAKESCRSLSGNANDICVKEAEARAAIAKAELETSPASVMMVGHLPHMNRLAGLLIYGDAERDAVEFAPATVVCVSHRGSRWQLIWALVADFL